MNTYKLIAPSLARSILYPIMVAGSFYFASQASEHDKYLVLQRQYQEALSTNSNLLKAVQIDKHISNHQGTDDINEQLKIERMKLLANKETRQEYALGEKMRECGNKVAMWGGIGGMVAGPFCLLGAATIWNTLNNRRNKRKKAN